jgi:hypothetical protein
MQSKVTSYLKQDSQSDSEGSIGNTSKAKYQILPTNDDEASLANCHYPPTPAAPHYGGVGKIIHGAGIEQVANSSSPLFPTDQNKNGELHVSPVVIAKFLKNELKSKNPKHCETCSCATKNLIELDTMFNAGTQTEITTLACSRCHSNLNSPTHTYSPFLTKLKSSDSVISETKSSLSDFINNNEKIPFTPTKKDDLMINPILGHHKFCEHTKSFIFPASATKKDETTKVKETPDQKPSTSDNKIETKIDEKSKSATKMSHGAGGGSANSVWSRTSSNKEGAKLFENFNRNLIKTMRVRFRLPSMTFGF